MSGLFGLLIFLVGVLGFIVAVIPESKPIPPPYVPPWKTQSFTAALKKGDFECVIHYEESSEFSVPAMERAIRRWAIELDAPVNSKALHDALEAELKTCFPSYRLEVISLRVPDPEPDEVAQATLSNQLVARMKTKIECANALLAFKPETKLACSLDDYLERDIKHTINGLFHDLDHV